MPSPTDRYHDHALDDRRSPPDLLPKTKKLVEEYLPMMINQKIESGDLYTGYAGTAYILFRLGCYPLERSDDGRHYFEKALKVLQNCPHSRSATFLTGDPGVQALEIACRSRLDMSYGEQLREFVNPNFAADECELLYGRAGTLQAIQFLRRELYHPTLLTETVKRLVAEIVAEANRCKKEGRLWKWHDKEYLGAAHGAAGILLILCHFDKEFPIGFSRADLRQFLVQCMEMQFPSGNMPSRVGADYDELVHWCHGAPGWVAPLLKFEEIRKALKCGLVTWERGILTTKGLGLCHGTAGNAYSFLQIYQHTGDELWLRRAQHFAWYMVDKWDELYDIADNQLSLFEGVGGALSLLLDLRNPSDARFCGWTVQT